MFCLILGLDSSAVTVPYAGINSWPIQDAESTTVNNVSGNKYLLTTFIHISFLKTRFILYVRYVNLCKYINFKILFMKFYFYDVTMIWCRARNFNTNIQQFQLCDEHCENTT